MRLCDDDSTRELFGKDPAAFLERAIKEYVVGSPENRLQAFDGEPIWDEPLVGFADGDDAIFRDYKVIIGDFHLTPREALERHLARKKGREEHPAAVSVIAFVLPATYKTRLSNRRETLIASRRWNHTRFQGQDFINGLSRYVVSLLEGLGYQAVAPELTDFFRWKDFSGGLSSNWSQRHVAYAAGLGTFGLSGGLITPRGIAVRCGSVVTDARLISGPRAYGDYRADCLFYRNGSCRRCIERCPAGAISERGHDKEKCGEFLFVKQKQILKELEREGDYIGPYPACGLCQTKVPCEARVPWKAGDESRKRV